MYTFVGLCTRAITSHELNPIQHQLKNALKDIIQHCLASPGHKNERLLEYLETLCHGAEDKRMTIYYGDAALLFASFVVQAFLKITKKTRRQIKVMSKGLWITYKDLLTMRLTVIEEWQDRLQQLSEPCQNAVQTSNKGPETPLTRLVKNLFRIVEADIPLDVKASLLVEVVAGEPAEVKGEVD